MANEVRLIDASALRNALYDADSITTKGVAIINQFPTVDAVEVVHARWDKRKDDELVGYDTRGNIQCRKVHSYYCTKCGQNASVKSNYCPNCGAKMYGGN